MDVALKRPDKKNDNILLCIPGAYTDLNNLKVDGLYIDNGIVYNRNAINHTLGGAIKIIKGEVWLKDQQSNAAANSLAIACTNSISFSAFEPS